MLNPARSLSRHPLFQVMLAFRAAPAAALELAGLAVTPEPIGTVSAKFDLSVALTERRSAAGEACGIEGVIEYAGDLFDRGTVATLAQRLLRLLGAAAGDAGRPIGSYRSWRRPSARPSWSSWNDTARAVAAATLPELFAAQARAHAGCDRGAVRGPAR